MNIETTRVWDVDNQLVIADTPEQAISIAREYLKDYYDHNEVKSIQAISTNNGIMQLETCYIAIIEKEEK